MKSYLMKKNTLAALFVLVSAGYAWQVQAAPLTLVKDGQPNATIVVEADAPENVKIAAADLQLYLQKISGVQLPLKTDGVAVDGITLNVGKTQATLDTDLPDEKLNIESYAIRQREDDIYFSGRLPSPTAFAVYSFLQDNLGVRWFAPGDAWEHVPRSNTGNLTVDVKDVVSSPGTSPRIWSGHYWTASWNRWMLRNKVTRGEVRDEFVPHRNFQNNIYRIFPPSRYAQTHPEYYPLVNGKRYIPKDDKERLWWPCIGNPAVQQAVVAYMRDYFDRNPHQDSFSLGMDDIIHNCSDPLCRAMDARPDDYEKGRFSDRFYKFINIVAKDLKKTHPDKFIGMLVYRHTITLPETVPEIESNVFGFLADGGVSQWHHPGKKENWMNTAREWSKRMKHLSRYDYYGMGTFAPRVYTRAIDEAIKFDKSLGFEGMYTEMYTFLPQTAPMIWSFARLQWDHKQNVDVLLDDFYNKMFGAGAPTMRRYFDLMEKSWYTPRPNHDSWVHYDILRQAVSISPEALEEGTELLKQAKLQAKSAIQKQRIGIVQGGLQYAGFAIQEYTLAQKLAALDVKDEASAKVGMETVLELGKVIGERQPYWAAAMKRKDLLGENLRGLYEKKSSSGRRMLQTDTTPLDSPAIPAVLRVMDWYQTHQPERATEVALAMKSAFPAGTVFETPFAWQTVQQAKVPSLIKNGDFESTVKATAAAEDEGWDTKNAPSFWASWSRMGEGKSQRAQSRGGKGNAWQVATPVFGDKAALLQNVPVKAGQQYLASVWLKREDVQNGRYGFSLRFRTAEGWYKGTDNLITVRPERIGGWQQLMVAFTAPETVTTVAVMLEVEGKPVVFDDVALYPVPGNAS
jgi:hypothetical protein